MPGYGTLPATEGTGLLPWSWAVERLAGSHDFWLATVTPQGAPHLMPVWAVWHTGRLWFSSANGSRKARNLGAGARCTVSTDNPQEPVVVHGLAERIASQEDLAAMLAAENAKYRTSYGPEMVDPRLNSVYALRLEWVFALDARELAGSPTRFTFAAPGWGARSAGHRVGGARHGARGPAPDGPGQRLRRGALVTFLELAQGLQLLNGLQDGLRGGLGPPAPGTADRQAHDTQGDHDEHGRREDAVRPAVDAEAERDRHEGAVPDRAHDR